MFLEQVVGRQWRRVDRNKLPTTKYMHAWRHRVEEVISYDLVPEKVWYQPKTDSFHYGSLSCYFGPIA